MTAVLDRYLQLMDEASTLRARLTDDEINAGGTRAEQYLKLVDEIIPLHMSLTAGDHQRLMQCLESTQTTEVERAERIKAYVHRIEQARSESEQFMKDEGLKDQFDQLLRTAPAVDDSAAAQRRERARKAAQAMWAKRRQVK